MVRSLIGGCVVFCAVLLAGCAKSPPPPPDGSSSIQGKCLLPAEPPDEDGKAPDRQPWAGVIVTAREVNNPDGNNERQFHTTAGDNGEFKLDLNPGQYLVGLHDPERLAGKMLSPMLVRVEPGKFTDIVLDYDKLNVRDIPQR